MIDIIVNTSGCITIAHTVKALDGYDAMEISRSDGAVILSGPEGRRSIGTLRGPMLELVRPAMTGQSVRITGWSIARVSPLKIVVH